MTKILPELVGDLKAAGIEAVRTLERALVAHRNVEDAAKETDVAGAARIFIAVREAGEAIDEAVTQLHKVRQSLQTVVIPEKFQLAGVTSFTVDDSRVTISQTLSVTMTDKVGGMEWLRANGLEGIIQETVNASTLKATVKNMIEDQGIEPPEDMFKVTPIANTSVTKVKKKAGT